MICKIFILALVLTGTVNTQNCDTIDNCIKCDIPEICDECQPFYFIDSDKTCTACLDKC